MSTPGEVRAVPFGDGGWVSFYGTEKRQYWHEEAPPETEIAICDRHTLVVRRPLKVTELFQIAEYIRKIDAGSAPTGAEGHS